MLNVEFFYGNFGKFSETFFQKKVNPDVWPDIFWVGVQPFRGGSKFFSYIFNFRGSNFFSYKLHIWEGGPDPLWSSAFSFNQIEVSKLFETDKSKIHNIPLFRESLHPKNPYLHISHRHDFLNLYWDGRTKTVGNKKKLSEKVFLFLL